MNAVPAPLAKGWPVLIRREFWEHRSLWIAPLVVAALYLVACLITASFGTTRTSGGPLHVSGSPVLFAQLMFTAVLFALMSIVIFFYLADCLYAERRDRSILFWKSLPVSDTATVLTKLAVALLIVPLGLYVLAFVTNLVAFVILYVRLHNDAVLGQLVTWDTTSWLRLNGIMLVSIFVLALWYAPVAAYQLLVSAWAKGSVLVWTVLPPLVLIFGERLLFGTWYVAETLRDRVGINIAGVAASGRATRGASGPRGLFDSIDVFSLLTAPAMWIGVAIAAGLVFGAIRIRRYRDDS
jgi:ABC-2 type transport system permease protein